MTVPKLRSLSASTCAGSIQVHRLRSYRLPLRLHRHVVLGVPDSRDHQGLFLPRFGQDPPICKESMRLCSGPLAATAPANLLRIVIQPCANERCDYSHLRCRHFHCDQQRWSSHQRYLGWAAPGSGCYCVCNSCCFHRATQYRLSEQPIFLCSVHRWRCYVRCGFLQRCGPCCRRWCFLCLVGYGSQGWKSGDVEFGSARFSMRNILHSIHRRLVLHVVYSSNALYHCVIEQLSCDCTTITRNVHLAAIINTSSTVLLITTSKIDLYRRKSLLSQLNGLSHVNQLHSML